MICHSGREKMRAPSFSAAQRTRVQLTAPRTTAPASARDRSRLLLCAVWLPITANQKPMFHGLLSAKNSPSEYPRCFRSSDETVASLQRWLREIRQAERANVAVKTKSSVRLTPARACRMDGEFRSAPAPSETDSAHMKSPVHAPRPIGHADQNPPPRCLGTKPRRIISAFTGPGGQATDQPSTNPLTRTDIKIAPGARSRRAVSRSPKDHRPHFVPASAILERVRRREAR